MKTRVIALALAAALAACSDDPTEPDDIFASASLFAGFDDDSNGVLSETEFEAALIRDDWFGDLDDDDNEVLTDEELDTELGDAFDDGVLFATFDANADGHLEAIELIAGLFAHFDVDHDGGVTQAEFALGVEIFQD